MVNRIGKTAFSLFLVFFLCLFPFDIESQDLIALHPFRGQAQDAEITRLFFDRMETEIANVSGGNYRTFRIDLDNLPPDVPPGGFPPWISPSPSITRDAAYAVTGEAAPDLDFEGGTRIRLYLWRLEGARLLGSDEMTLFDPQDLGTVPSFMTWVLSWIADDTVIYAEGGVIYVPSEPEIIYYNPNAYEPNWLYLGLRGGGGYSRWTYDLRDTSRTSEVSSFMSLNFAFQAAFYFTNFFGIQTEAQINYDFTTNSNHGEFNTFGLTLPLLGKLVLRGERVKAALFAGISLYLPLSHTGDSESHAYFNYTPDFPGFVFGLTAGWRIGPGNIIIDGRLEYDLHWSNPILNQINYRTSTRFSIGYEIGFLPKQRSNNQIAPPAAPPTAPLTAAPPPAAPPQAEESPEDEV